MELPEVGYQELVKDFFNNEIITAYRGNITFNMVNMLLADLKRELTLRKLERRVSSKAYNISVECLENLLKHSDQSLSGNNLYLIKENNQRITITVGNLVCETELPKLEKSLARIDGKNLDEIKELYRFQISNGEISEKGGAGLGLMDMAIKSDNHIFYQLQRISPSHSLFLLTINIE